MADIHFLEGPFVALSLAQAVAGFRGAVAVVEVSVAGEGSVVGDNKK